MTMFSAPEPAPFLSAHTDIGEPDVTIVGVATDGGVSFRGGAELGPTGIRLFSDSIETWSPDVADDLERLQILDAGDYTGALEGTTDAIRQLTGDGLLVAFGGDHSVTPHIVKAVRERHQDLVVVGFDAHLDLRHSYVGEHACAFRRIVDQGIQTHVFGVRSGEKAEWDDAPRVFATCSPDPVIDADAMASILAHPVYLTIDIDVFDPSEAPGTGTLEAGGATWTQIRAAMEKLRNANIVAFDIVEVAPAIDPSGVTQALAAKLARDNILRFTQRA